jgi:histidyl-tRNA synthetase
MSQKINSIRGMEDLFDPEEVKKWHWVEHKAREIFQTAGFQEIRTPILEEATLFERSVGDTTEIVEKEMYTLLDRNGKKLAMRPEGTASVVRAFVEHFTSHQIQEGRFYYFGPMFRYERPQKGRLRQLHQVGVEVFGVDHPWVDAEVIGLIHQYFFEVGIEHLTLSINSLGTRECRERYLKALSQFLSTLQDALCDECQKRMDRNPLRVLDCKKEGCIEATAKAPQIFDFLSDESKNHFLQLQEGLKSLNIPYQINHRLVRGLDYYEKTVFEFLSGELGAQNSVAGGGRYNDLVKDLGGPQVPAIGFAVGIERLISILHHEKIPFQTKTRVYLVGLDEDSTQELFKFLKPLRASGLVVEQDFAPGSLKSKMRRADRWKAEYVAICGEEERKRGVVILRNMKNQSQEEVLLQDFAKKFNKNA